MSGFLDPILGASAVVVLTVVALVVFVEDAFFVGFVVPGETAAILGGVAASRGHVSVSVMVLVVVVAAVVGDSVGYEVGRQLGPRIMSWEVMARRRERLDRATAFLARRGGVAVLLGRWTAFFRAVMPALAGMAQMPYPRFLLFNATGGVAWGVATVLAGYFAGESFTRVERYLGRGAAVVIAALVLVLLAVWVVRRRRAEQPDGSDDPAPV